MVLQITVNAADLQGHLQDMTEAVPRARAISRAALESVLLGILEDVKAATPVQTGKLQGAWEMEIRGDEGVVFNRTPYAAFVQYGTGEFGPLGTPIVRGPGEKPFVFEKEGRIVVTRRIRGRRPVDMLGAVDIDHIVQQSADIIMEEMTAIAERRAAAIAAVARRRRIARAFA